jgi:hypothetical protein
MGKAAAKALEEKISQVNKNFEECAKLDWQAAQAEGN